MDLLTWLLGSSYTVSPLEVHQCEVSAPYIITDPGWPVSASAREVSRLSCCPHTNLSLWRVSLYCIGCSLKGPVLKERNWTLLFPLILILKTTTTPELCKLCDRHGEWLLGELERRKIVNLGQENKYRKTKNGAEMSSQATNIYLQSLGLISES